MHTGKDLCQSVYQCFSSPALFKRYSLSGSSKLGPRQKGTIDNKSIVLRARRPIEPELRPGFFSASGQVANHPQNRTLVCCWNYSPAMPGTHLYTWVEWGNRSKVSFPRKHRPQRRFEPPTSKLKVERLTSAPRRLL